MSFRIKVLREFGTEYFCAYYLTRDGEETIAIRNTQEAAEKEGRKYFKAMGWVAAGISLDDYYKDHLKMDIKK